MSHAGRIVVVGSLNADLTVYTERLPLPGETVMGSGFAVHPGGKSANQAVAAGLLGGAVALVGAVGDDANGQLLLDSAARAGVDTAHVRRVDGQSTGIAAISVDARGENSIIVAAGANGLLAPADIDAAEAAFAGAAVVCLCLESPLETVLAAARAGRRAGACVLLNLSPYLQVPAELIELADILIVNVHEAANLLDGLDPEQEWEAARDRFAALGLRSVVVTRGGEGSAVLDTTGSGGGIAFIAPTPVEVVDTTGSGDAFTGAVATRLAAGDRLVEAARYASVAAALAATRKGAQTSYPTRSQVEARFQYS
jgi:ribokinase